MKSVLVVWLIFGGFLCHPSAVTCDLTLFSGDRQLPHKIPAAPQILKIKAAKVACLLALRPIYRFLCGTKYFTQSGTIPLNTRSAVKILDQLQERIRYLH